jgi:diaminopimelate decarboxylase
MEDDVLAPNIQLPPNVREGDLLAVCDAGGYDSSMSYTFGLGGTEALCSGRT